MNVQMLNASDSAWVRFYDFLQALCKDLSRDDVETGAPDSTHHVVCRKAS